MGYSSNIVLTNDHLQDVVREFDKHEDIVFDLETNGPNRGTPHLAPVKWIAMSVPGTTVTIPMGHINGDHLVSKATRKLNKETKKYLMIPAVWSPPPVQLKPSVVWPALERLLMNPDRTLTGHGALFDFTGIPKYYGGRITPAKMSDTIVIQWLLNENRRTFGLKDLVTDYFGHDYDNEHVGRNIDLHPFSKVGHYAFLDSKYTLFLKQGLFPRLQDEGLTDIYNLEMDVLRVLVKMRLTGARVDREELERLEVLYSDELVDLEAEVYKAAGQRFNINSVPQKQKILFGPLEAGGQGLKVTRTTKTGAPSTDAETLEAYPENPLAKSLVEYADVSKLLSTYVQGYLGVPDDPKKPCQIFDDRIHADFVQYGTVTGRFSCVSGDTLIETPRDLSKHPGGIPISEMKKGDYVYAFDHHRQLVLRQIKWVAQTGVKKTLIVTLENSTGDQKVIRLTPEHLVMLRNGDWRPAANLLKAPTELTRANPRQVMTMVRRNFDGGYSQFFPNAQAKGQGTNAGGKNREHRWILSQIMGKKLSTKYDVDHIDGNKWNNHPSNLRYIPSVEHRGHREGFAWGVEQPPLPDVYSGKLDYRAVSLAPGPLEPVWDMEVDEVHNFIGNGVCVHNCRAPNLQNIPRPDTEKGKQIRGLFMAEPGERLVVADYGQIELVVLAHYSRAKALVDGFNNGIDAHTLTAAKVYGVDFGDVTKPMRQTAKGINFAVVYGAGPDKVASMADIKVKEAKRFLGIHEMEFPEIYSFKDAVLKTARKRKPPYIKTLMGRKRRLPDLNYSDRGKRGYAERQAVNSLIQGSSADLIKLAMVRLNNSLPEHSSLILSVHDELVVRTPTQHAEEVQEIMREAMLGEGISSWLTVPMTTDSKIVEKWAEAK